MTLPTSTKRHDGGKIPGPAAVPQTIEIKCMIQLPNNKSANFIVHGSYVTAPANMQAVASGLFTSISSAWGTNLAALMHTGTSFLSVAVRDMASATNPVFIGQGTAVAGSSASAAMPENNAIVMTENVNQRGRGAKGRVFLGGWATNADAGAGLISAAAQTAVNNFGTALNSAITGQSLTPCVAQVHRQQYIGITGTTHADRPANHVGVTSYVCRDLVWDTQRRRIQP